MPYETPNLKFDGQLDFSGGMALVGRPAVNGYRWAKNIVIRDGKATTRPGIRGAFRNETAGFQEAFYFNQDNARYNDATHTGFWFTGFSFIGSIWGSIQGLSLVRFSSDLELKLLVCAGGRVYVNEAGFVREIPVNATIGADEDIYFVQANQVVMMFRGEGNAVLQWDGGSDGFIQVPDPAEGDRIPTAASGTYIGGRLWIPANRDDLYASDVLDFTAYDYAYQLFSVNGGDGDEIVKILPWKDDGAIVFKKRSTYYVGGVNSYVMPGTHLSDYVRIGAIDNDHGLVAKQAVVTYGEQVAYLGYGGIYNLQRNQYGKAEGVDVPLSAPIKPLIDRINWNAVSIACAAAHDNYLLFAVPIDGSTVNNTVLVYDTLLKTWVSEWQSEMLKPVQFGKMEEDLYILGTDGRLRLMFTDDPWDSEDVFVDTRNWSASTYYHAGDHALYTVGGDKKVYRALLDGENHATSDTDYWVEETDPQNLYRIETEIWTRWYDGDDAATGKKPNRGEIIYDAQNPSISVDIDTPSYNTDKSLFAAKTYDRKKYDVIDTADWVESNENIDWHNPHRQDYSVFLTTPSLLFPVVNGGLDANTYNLNFDDGLTGWTVSNGSGTSIPEYGSAVTEEGRACAKLTQRSAGVVELLQSVSVPAGTYYAYVMARASAPITVTVLAILAVTAPVTVSQGTINLTTEFTRHLVTWNTPSVAASTMTGSILYACRVPAGTGGIEVFIDWITFGGLENQNTLLMDSTGLNLNVWSPHSLRFLPMLANDKRFGFKIRNTQGKLALCSIRQSLTQNRFGARDNA